MIQDSNPGALIQSVKWGNISLGRDYFAGKIAWDVFIAYYTYKLDCRLFPSLTSYDKKCAAIWLVFENNKKFLLPVFEPNEVERSDVKTHLTVGKGQY